MMMKVLFVFLFLGTTASSNPIKEKKTAEAQPVMGVFLDEVKSLYPYIVSYEKFSSKQKESEIKQHIEVLLKNSSQLSHFDSFKSLNFKLTTNVMQEHIARLSETFNSGNKIYAHWMLGSLLQGCASCHAQLSSRVTPAYSLMPKDFKGSLFEKAEVFFATRNFSEALKNYNAIIESYPKLGASEEKVSADQLETALRKKLAIFLRIERDPATALVNLNADSANEKLPKNLRELIAAWTKNLQRKELLGLSKAEKHSFSKLEKLSKTWLQEKGGDSLSNMNPDLAPQILLLSGAWYEFLTSTSTPEQTASALYWLSISDRLLNMSYFFSMSDLYLRECIEAYPKSKIAKQCFKEFEKSIEFQYSGSRGLDIPAETKLLLNKLKKQVQ